MIYTLRYLLLLIGLFLFGCSPKKTADKIPFFTSPDFTPQWISVDDAEYKNIHQIADFTFTDQNGNSISNQTFKGKIYIANFFFTVCPGICPLMTENMIKLQQKYIDEPNVLLLSHTVTPWIDTVEQLKKYAIENEVMDDKYHLVTGSQDEIYNLARKSYFVEKEIGMEINSDEFLHSENFILVDPLGRLRGIYNGTSTKDLLRLKEDIDILLEHI